LELSLSSGSLWLSRDAIGEKMNSTAALTGAVPAAVVVSAVLTALVSVLLLWLYRRAVVRAMAGRAGVLATAATSVRAATDVRESASLSFTLVDSVVPPRTPLAENPEFRLAMQSLNKITLVYALGGLAYALVLTAVWMITLGDGFILTRFLWLLSCHCWPILLSVSLVNPFMRKRAAVAYCALVLVIAGVVLFRNPGLTAGELLYFWLSINAPTTVLLGIFLNRHVRAVGPLVLAFMVVAVTGAVIAVELVGSSEELMRGAVRIGNALGLGAKAIFVCLHLLGFCLLGLFGWQLLRWIGQRYQHKRMSDQSISLDALWIVFGVVQSYTFVFDGWGWIFTGIVAFAAYKLVSSIGLLSCTRRSSATGAPRTLLLLRVFSLAQCSRRLFDLLSKVWLRSGNINLISGPDLATTTIEPDEFLDFLAGRLARRFVQGEEDLEQRLSEIDSSANPDGRYRVHEFLCAEDTWQMTMQRLASVSDAVLMDLRSFSQNNQGCLFEIQQLIEHIPLERIVLAIDSSTDRAFLARTITTLYHQLDPASPNAARKGSASLSLFSVRAKGHREVEKLLSLLFRASRGSQPAPAA
jgi:hypothetical protein